MPTFSRFVQELTVETAFDVLVRARQLKYEGKDVVELEIGDSPFRSTKAACEAAVEALNAGLTSYCPSGGIPELRHTAAEFIQREYGVPVSDENIVVGPGAKPFELFFCELFLEPGDGVLVFSPFFPTYLPNIQRRGARAVYSPLKMEREFRPNLDDVERFLAEDPSPKAIFLNSPHNPTGGVATKEDLEGLADLIRGKNVALFSDEPYDRMVWKGRHHTPLAEPGMIEQTVAAYTLSKSYSMSGWRLGFAVTSPDIATQMGKLINTSLSCTPPFLQMGAVAALSRDNDESRENMAKFRRKVELLVGRLNAIDGIDCLMPGGTFYVFPSVAEVCNRLGITSHGLAMFLLEGADDRFGIACLGGECFGEAGAGFLRFSCAEPDERIAQACDFLAEAIHRDDRAKAYLESHPEYRLATPYPAGR
ncbi:MAG: aminotransferase class I/II-fold pyridoxal phosphate-dependent enzyme [Planctomycetota bacterium]|nr:MAG: aminotransferase class I/II-fold pyridoxal phosphate-dependent enzyme [Planctomycetota bacterium]